MLIACLSHVLFARMEQRPLAKEKNKSSSDISELMVVNENPGEECRIAILQDHHLEELYSERAGSATDVGNIYKGRVTNVEPAIQAAFVDYGKGQSGFLHISDLHPRYFPRGDRTEAVGRKIPRRDRPLMQEALRRGDEVLVQVLKQGIGTKGPTLTSYLSVPGRLLVMMPGMDRVGVSRRVEDEEQRRAMRDILDQLDLPDGFGFILRTAGFGATKTDLKRDVAYLMRLWKLMEKRRTTMPAPCELYAESDLLTRTVRDVLRPSIKAIVVDSRLSAKRAEAFLNVVTPRSAPQVIYYTNHTPIFHAFDIERQIDQIHSRKVTLPSGGELVIDQTEALVAIDVNSGKSRSARDSETNAYQTNQEAVDEICRQLRLRDLGGLIINDLIDMRSPGHRRDIEERFRQNLKRDRAKTTVLRISEFGIVEMTRQRMRPSLRKTHFMACPHCDGRGEIKTPESVASGAMRHIAFLLQYDRVRRVEMVCSLQVASVMLSAKRRELVRLEDQSGKKIHVRVSEAFAADRVDYYAYDDRNADIDISRLPVLALPSLDQLRKESDAAKVAQTKMAVDGSMESGGHGDFHEAMSEDEFALDEFDDLDELAADESSDDEAVSAGANDTAAGQDGQRKRRRRGRRGGRGRRRGGQPATQPGESATSELLVQGDGASMPGEPDVMESADAEREQADDVALANVEASQHAEVLRVHELAKELGVSSREIVEKCQDNDEAKVRSPMSSVASALADQVRRWFGVGRSSAASKAARVSASEAHRQPIEQGEQADHSVSQPALDGETSDEARAIDEEYVSPLVEVSDSEADIDDAREQRVEQGTGGEGDGRGRRRRRRRGRGRRGGSGGNGDQPHGQPPVSQQPRPVAEPMAKPASQNGSEPRPRDGGAEGEGQRPRSRRGRRGGRGRGRKFSDGQPTGGAANETRQGEARPAAVQAPKPEPAAKKNDAPAVQVVRPRRLYGSRSKISASELSRSERADD